MAQTTWNVKLRRAEVLNMSWSGAAVIAGELLDKHGYQYTFCIAAGLCAVALVVFSPLLLLKLQRLPSEPVEVSPNANAQSGAAEVVVVVDPFSTGGFLAAELLSQGCAVIALWTKESNIRYHDARIALSITKHFVDAPSWLAKDCETSSKNGKAVKHVWDLELTWIIHFSQYFTLTRCIHAGFGAIFPCFPQDYPKIFDPRQLLAELDEEPTVEATAARLREAWLSLWTAGCAGCGTTLSPCVAISWSKFFDVLDPSRSGVRVRSSGKRVGKQFLLRLPNLQDFGFIKSGYKTCSNSLGTPDTFGLVTLISRFSMEMGIDGSQGQGSIMFHRNRIWRLKPFSVWPLAKLSIWRTGERSPNQKDEGESGFTVYDVTLLCNLKGTFGKNATTCNQCNKGSQDNSNLSLQGYRKICVHVGTRWNTLPRWTQLDPVGPRWTPLGHAGPRGPVRWLIALAVAWQLWFAEATAASTPQMPWAKHWICAAMASAMAIVETNWCNTRRWKQPVWDLHAQWAEPHGNRLVRTSC